MIIRRRVASYSEEAREWNRACAEREIADKNPASGGEGGGGQSMFNAIERNNFSNVAISIQHSWT